MGNGEPWFPYSRLTKVIREFRTLWKNYLYQSFLASVATLLIFWVLSAEHAVIVASVGSTAFTVFAMPSSITTASRRVVGGHIMGLLCGALGAIVTQRSSVTPMIVYSAIVGLSVFLMVALDFEHPPAAGTALGVAIGGYSFKVLLAVLTSALVLSLAHRYMRKYLKDLI